MLRLAALAVLLAAPAYAASIPVQCMDYQTTAKELREKYGEQVRGAGLTKNGQTAFMVWANPKTGTWTITFRQANGGFCIVAAGEGWSERKVEVPGEDS